MSDGPHVKQADVPSVGMDGVIVFAGLEPKQQYRLHVLFPSGESVYRRATTDADGELTFKYAATAPAQHVIEVHSGDPDERVVEAVAHVRPLEQLEGE